MSYESYIQDESQYGKYQYVGLEEVIANFIAMGHEDDYTSGYFRHQILYQAKRGIRELYYDVSKEIRAVELDLGPTLTVVMPPDFVNYVRISWVDDKGNLHPMAVNPNTNIASAYLQDDQYQLLFDNEGCVLQGSGTTDDSIAQDDENNSNNYHCYNFSPQFTPNINRSDIFPNGSYRIDKAAGLIKFSSDAFGKSIVLEYISDGLFVSSCEGKTESDIRIHKFAEQALIDFIYYNLIKQRRNVPFNEKRRARREYFRSRKMAIRRINTIRKDELLQVFKGADVWNKMN